MAIIYAVKLYFLPLGYGSSQKDAIMQQVTKNNRFKKEIDMVTGYSVKAKKKVEIIDPAIYKTAKGGFMAKGKCPETGITVCAMMSKDNAEKAMEDGAKKAF
jgi:hypothetical protein